MWVLHFAADNVGDPVADDVPVNPDDVQQPVSARQSVEVPALGEAPAVERAPAVGDAPLITLPPSKLKSPRRRSPLRSIVEWVVVVGGAFLLAVLIQTFAFQPFRIPSGSMIPTLQVRDRIVVNKLSYRLHPVHRGDVVVFTRPKCDAPASPKWANCAVVGEYADLVKRVIALPGDRVGIANDHVYINGRAVSEPYVRPGAVTLEQPYGCTFPGSRVKPYTVPVGMVFVMGDNRDNSLDGRCFGPIPKSSLVGRASLIIWPISRIGWL